MAAIKITPAKFANLPIGYSLILIPRENLPFAITTLEIACIINSMEIPSVVECHEFTTCMAYIIEPRKFYIQKYGEYFHKIPPTHDRACRYPPSDFKRLSSNGDLPQKPFEIGAIKHLTLQGSPPKIRK